MGSNCCSNITNNTSIDGCVVGELSETVEQDFINGYRKLSDNQVGEIVSGMLGNIPEVTESTEIVYIPVLFTANFKEEYGLPSDEKKNQVYQNCVSIIESANKVLEGNYIPKTYHYSPDNLTDHSGLSENGALLAEGNWKTSNSAHNTRCNVRFFLLWKLPKEYLYPFGKYIGTPETKFSSNPIVDVSSVEGYTNSFYSGVTDIEDPNNIGYESQYTYSDIVEQRKTVIGVFNSPNYGPMAEQSTKNILKSKEDEYFFFFGNTPGLLFIPEFEDTSGFEPYKTADNNIRFPWNISNLIARQTGSVPGSEVPLENFRSEAIYETTNNVKRVSKYFLSNIPCLKITSSIEESSEYVLGSAKLGNSLSSVGMEGFFLTTLGDYINPRDNTSFLNIATLYNSIFLHEFYHLLGYNHPTSGVTISGTINDFNIKNYLKREKTRFSQILDFNNFYLPFSPPFLTYDPFNENHSLDDITSLPDFETIDPNEKLFVESTVKYHLKKVLDNFSNDFTFTETETGSSFYQNFKTFVKLQGSKKQKEMYGGLYGTMSHLPTFWGGSYTINEDGTKSMLINASDTASSPINETPQIGSIYEGGIVIKVNTNRTVLIAASFDLSAHPSSDYSTNYSRHENLLNALNSKTYPYNKDKFNLATQYSDWRIPTIEELVAIAQEINSIDDYTPSKTYYSSTLGGRPGTVKCSKLTTSSAYQSIATTWGGQPWDGSKSMSRYVRPVRTVTLDSPSEETSKKGPNITIYNPVCSLGNNKIYNLSLPLTLDWYNDKYPPFPNNTRVEDMFSPELCPCLYEDQEIKPDPIYNGENTPIKVKLFTAKIDEITGEPILNTTGIQNQSREAKTFSYTFIHSKESANTDLEKRIGIYGMNSEDVENWFGYAGNEGTNPFSIYGSYTGGNIQYASVTPNIEGKFLKQVGDIIIPNFPVYIGFMHDSPLPNAFNLDPNKISSLTSSNEKYSMYQDYGILSSINDNSLYNSWGYNFTRLKDKYLRIGSADPNNNSYNPFKIDPTTSGISNYLKGISVNYNNTQLFSNGASTYSPTMEDWETYKIHKETIPKSAGSEARSSAGSLGSLGLGGSSVKFKYSFETFFNRQLPNKTYPALDRIQDTLHGPVNQNTFTNIMYYGDPAIEPKLPSEDMLKKLNFLANTADKGHVYIWKNFSKDMFDVENLHKDILNDFEQKQSNVNTIQDYIYRAFNLLKTERVSYESLSYGCTDPEAFNYNPNATFDNNTCIKKVYGCTNPDAHNFDVNLNANVDDGSCDTYNLIASPIKLIKVCSPSFTNACNINDDNIPILDYYNYDIDQTLNLNNADILTSIESGYAPTSIVPRGNNLTRNMIDNNEYYAWKTIEGISYMDYYRYTGGDCDNPLGSDHYGALNLGGGCIRVYDPTVCIFPTITKYNCDIITNASLEKAGRRDYNVIINDDDSSMMSYDEFADYFQSLSEDVSVTIGNCETL